MEFKMWTLSESGSSGQIKSKASVESDIIVPDKKPDIYRILCVKATPDLSDYQLRKDKISYSGEIKYIVFYIGEDDQKKIYTMEYIAPFTHIADFSKVSDKLTLKSQCSVVKTIFDVKNSRKISVGAFLDIKTEWIDNDEIQVIESTDIPVELAYKSEECSYDCLRCSSEFEFDVSDTITLDAGGDIEIYDVQIHNDISEIKAVNNKAVIKGQANVFVLFSGDDQLHGYNTEIPFTEIVDIDNLSSELTLVSHFETSKVDYSFSDQTDRTDICVEFKLRGSIWGYEKQNCNLATDMYSPDYAYNVRLKKCSLTNITSARDTKVTLKNTLAVRDSSSNISRVYYSHCNAVAENFKISGGQLKISGNLEATVIYSDNSDNLRRIGETTPFEAEIDLPGASENSIVSVDLSCTNSGFVLTSPVEVQVRTVAKINAVAFETKEQQIISGFSIDEKAPVKRDNQASIVIYYPDSDSCLWDIAKKYNTTLEEIISVNSLDNENSITPGVPIIIPKRHIIK